MRELKKSLFIESEEELREKIDETFVSHEKSRQATGVNKYHTDGENMRQQFNMKSLADTLRLQERENHPMAKHPRAFIDPIVHVRDHDLHAIERILDTGEDVVDVLEEYDEQFPLPRRQLLSWLAEDRDRLEKVNKGGKDVFIHGLPGSTKTTLLGYLACRVMEANNETVVWTATPGRSEWLMLAPWATVAFPEGVQRRTVVEPFNTRIGRFELDMDAFARDVITYTDPEDLMEQMRDRPDGQLYVTYPDPEFRGCEFLVGENYTSVWEAEDIHGTTPLEHWWFAWAKARVEGPYSYWTSLIGDEVDEWLDSDASDDEHGTYYKVKGFKDSFREFRKDHLSFFLACHNRDEVHSKVTKKLRWTATMNQEETPPDAPTDGDVTSRMDLGEGLIWKAVKYASFSWPNLKRFHSIPARVTVEYPQYDAELRRKGGKDTDGESAPRAGAAGGEANA